MSKINKLLRSWPAGTIAVTPWLKKMKVYQQLMHAYEKSHWVERIGQGAFIRAGDKATWPGGLYAVQAHLKQAIHVGGKTALDLHGYSHFVSPTGKAPVYLYGSLRQKLPSWFVKRDWGVVVNLKLVNLFPKNNEMALTQKSMGSFEVTLSSAERAMMEVLHLVPHEQSFEEAELFMEGLGALRPDLVQRLLKACRSVKVKRLFMYLAEKCEHAWVKEISLAKIDLGSGNRLIVRGGKFNAKYKITVPK